MTSIEKLFEQYQICLEVCKIVEDAKLKKDEAYLEYDRALSGVSYRHSVLDATKKSLEKNYLKEMGKLLNPIKSNYIKFDTKTNCVDHRIKSYDFLSYLIFLGKKYVIVQKNGVSSCDIEEMVTSENLLSKLSEMSEIIKFGDVLTMSDNNKKLKMYLMNNLKELIKNEEEYKKLIGDAGDIKYALSRLPAENKFKRMLFRKKFERKDELTEKLAELEKRLEILSDDHDYFYSGNLTPGALAYAATGDDSNLDTFLEQEVNKLKQILSVISDFNDLKRVEKQEIEKNRQEYESIGTGFKLIREEYDEIDEKYKQARKVESKERECYFKIFDECCSDPDILKLIEKLDFNSLTEDQQVIINSIKDTMSKNLAKKLNG